MSLLSGEERNACPCCDERNACPCCQLSSMLTLSQVDVDARTSRPYYCKGEESLWDVPTDAIAQSVEEVPAVG